MGSARLDAKLVAAGLAPTRSRARDLILRGFVRVNGAVCERPGHKFGEARVELDAEAPRFVSRGAEKLIAALDGFGFDAANRIALDLGASTGGFTEVLLQRGARRVYSVDVGRDQLHPTLRADPRVASLEQRDARSLSRKSIADAIEALVADLSFISLMKALGPALTLTAPGAWLVAIIKPQFEAGPEGVGADGVVRSEPVRAAAIESVRSWISAQPGWRVHGVIPSPILGGSGNFEYLIGAARDA